MKHLRAKLLASVSLLIIAAIMVTSASYAWFTLSTKPEISGVKTTVVVNESLEIAYHNDSTAPGTSAVNDTEKADTYGNLISTTETKKESANKDTPAVGDGNFKTDYDAVEKTLRPITLGTGNEYLNGKDGTKTTKGKFYFPEYGDDGRVKVLKECVEMAIPGKATGTTTGFGYIIIPDVKTKATSSAAAVYYAASEIKVEIKANDTGYTAQVTNGKIAGYYVDNWVRSNTTGTFQILSAKDSTRSSGAANLNNEKGEGSFFLASTTSNNMTTTQQEKLAENIRVAFQFAGSTTAVLPGAVEANSTNDSTKGTYRLTDATTLGKFIDETATPATTGDTKEVKVNSDNVLRLYFYLDGYGVTNEIASTKTASTGVTVEGTWNFQFKNSGIVYSMDDTNVK